MFTIRDVITKKNAVLLDFVQIKIEGRPSILEEMTIPYSDGLFLGQNTLKMVGKFSQKKSKKTNPALSWSEENTAAYMGLPPPTRLSTKGANGQYKDNLDGQLSR